MRLCFDLDGVLCTGIPYETAVPNQWALGLLKRLKSAGHTIIIYTARGMGRHAGNNGLALATIGKLTLNQLADWGCVYDEIVFGKVSADYYIDDKAMNSIESLCGLLELEMPESDNVLSYRVGQLEKRVESLASRCDAGFSAISTQLSDIARQTGSFQEKVSQHSKDIEELQSVDEDLDKTISEVKNSTQSDINNIKVTMAEKIGPGAAAGGVIAILVGIVQHLIGG